MNFEKYTFKMAEEFNLEISIIKKNIVEVTFFKTSKWRCNSRWRQQPLFYTFGSCTAISQPILYIKPFWTRKIKNFHIPKAQKYSIQNVVNIQDGDITFIYPSV
jgi:hypothetical protein